MDSFYKSLRWVSDNMRRVAAFLLLAMTALTCTDVTGRFLRHPVFGSIELMSMMGALAVALSLPDTHLNNGHIGVEILIDRLPRRLRGFIELCTGLLSMALIALITWQMFDYSIKFKESGEVSMNLELPEYLIILAVAIGFAVFTLTTLRNITEALEHMRGK